jgi:hypothetical protein
MAKWQFLANPDLVLSGTWEHAFNTELPDFTISPPQPFVKLAIRITGTGTRPLYTGPIGVLTTASFETGVNSIVNLQGSEMAVRSGLWYASASQVGGIGDYVYTAPRADWPTLGFCFWSNGRAGGGTYEARFFVA